MLCHLPDMLYLCSFLVWQLQSVAIAQLCPWDSPTEAFLLGSKKEGNSVEDNSCQQAKGEEEGDSVDKQQRKQSICSGRHVVGLLHGQVTSGLVVTLLGG